MPDAGDDLYEPDLRALVEDAFSRLDRRLEAAAPTLAPNARAWMRSLSGAAPAETYFLHERAFPMVLLPWWLAAGLEGRPDLAFHGDVVYSTLNGYYFVRMIDDLMDREQPPASAAMPAMIFFHTEFQGSYRPYFRNGHPFWEAFERASFLAAETASADAGVDEIDAAWFTRVSARKIVGAMVPIAAVCHRSERADLVEPWSGFVDLLGCWHQMRNDMLDWYRDLAQGRRTYFLAEAARQAPALSAAEWVLSDGLPWGVARLDDWMAQLLDTAAGLGCPPLVTYLEGRHRAATQQWDGLAQDLEAIRRLASSLS
jgi:hypothetical protein